MKYLKIQNDGLLDIRLVALMGGTTKADDVYKIGQFGTGLKYTLAFLYRNNIDFKIFSGTEQVALSLETEEIRGEQFEIICINGNRTSITTKMGEDWEAWMIIREIWCNALDEGGQHKELTETIEGEEGKTTFFIQIDSQIREVLNKWDTYFIHGNTPISDTQMYAIHPGGESIRLYKNGVLIYEDKTRKAVFSYDIKCAQINELREYKGALSCDVSSALKSAKEEAVRAFIETVTDDHFEGKTLDYNWFNSFGETWREVIGNGKIIHKEARQKIEAKGVKIDLTGLVEVPKKLYEALVNQFDGIGALRIADKVNEFFEIHDANLELRIKEGLAVLESCGYFIHPELTFVYGVFGSKDTLARVDLDKKEILVSEKLIDRPLFDVVATLIEENEHFKTGYSDESRDFQQHFINLFAKTLLDKNEVRL